MSLAKTWHFSWNEFISLSLFVSFCMGYVSPAALRFLLNNAWRVVFGMVIQDAIKHIGIRVFGRKGSDDSPEEVEVGDVGLWCGFFVGKNTPGATNIAGWNMDPEMKMYFLLKMVIFHSY